MSNIVIFETEQEFLESDLNKSDPQIQEMINDIDLQKDNLNDQLEKILNLGFPTIFGYLNDYKQYKGTEDFNKYIATKSIISGYNSENVYQLLGDEYIKNVEKSNTYKYGLHCKSVDNYGGEGEGETYYIVYEITDTKGNIGHYRLDGYYQSYDGVTWNRPLEKVIKQLKTIVVYE